MQYQELGFVLLKSLLLNFESCVFILKAVPQQGHLDPLFHLIKTSHSVQRLTPIP